MHNLWICRGVSGIGERDEIPGFVDLDQCRRPFRLSKVAALETREFRHMTTGSLIFLGVCIGAAAAFLIAVAYGIQHTHNPR
jgi:surfactin synthase thioesterase subunit